MEVNEHSFLEELLSLKREAFCNNNYPNGVAEFISNGWAFDTFDDNPLWPISSNPAFFNFTAQTEPSIFHCSSNESYPFANEIPIQEDYYPSVIEDEDPTGPLCSDITCLDDGKSSCKVEIEQASTENPLFNMGLCGGERKTRGKKLDGQPSKNLMAERRRRKRLNDRLSMLRSIVPKISKMDRTSILGDTIDYMKELLERINRLQEEDVEENKNKMNFMGIFKEMKPNEVLVRNSPKFDVERRSMDTKIEICSAGKPGLLLSTVSTLEALGLEIQQCVISCFNDFSMQASCSEVMEQRAMVSSDDIKQALFRNAGYGGRCL